VNKLIHLQKLLSVDNGAIGHVLLLHRVCRDNNYYINDYLKITPEYLELVIRFFKSRDIEIVSLDECYHRIRNGEKSKQFVAFTIDDGYADILIHALPVFEREKIPFTLFLSTCFPNHEIVLWWYMLEDLVFRSNTVSIKDGEKAQIFRTVSWREKNDAFWKIRAIIMKFGHESLNSNLAEIFGETYPDVFLLTRKLSLSWDQVVSLSDHPLVTIGTHTVNHLALSKLNENIAKEEILRSIKIISEKIGKPVSYLAYPYGSVNEASEREYDIAEDCNIKMAFTAIEGSLYKHHSGRLTALPRISLTQSGNMSKMSTFLNRFNHFLSYKLSNHRH